MAAWVRVNDAVKSTRQYVNLDSGVYVLFTLTEEIDGPATVRTDQIMRAVITSHAGDTGVASEAVAALYNHIVDNALGPAYAAEQIPALADWQPQAIGASTIELDLFTPEQIQTMSDAQLEALAEGRSITPEQFDDLGRGEQPQPEEHAEI